MQDLFSHLSLADVHRDVIRNIVSIRESQDLFDDLTNKPDEWTLAQQVETQVRPPPYRSGTPVIDRPFEDAQWFNAIAWPFHHWCASRFSDGSFGVWYGCDSAQATVYESAYHWYRWFLCDAGFEHEPVVGERKLYAVTCAAALLDFRPLVSDKKTPGRPQSSCTPSGGLPQGRAGGSDYSDLLHKTDYTLAQSVGARIHREGHPGLVIPSARYAQGENYVVMNPAVLSNARFHCQLTYRVDGPRIVVEKTVGQTWMVIATADL